MNADLAVATLDEIMDELYSRYDALLIVVERPTKENNNKSETWTYYKGSISHALGLCQYARNRITEKQLNNSELDVDNDSL